MPNLFYSSYRRNYTNLTERLGQKFGIFVCDHLNNVICLHIDIKNTKTLITKQESQPKGKDYLYRCKF